MTNPSPTDAHRPLSLSSIESGTVLVALLLLIGVSAAVTPGFLSAENIANVLVQSVFIMILGIGMTYVLVTGGIDLSVGSTMGLSATLCIWSLNQGVPVAPAVLIGLVSGLLVGAFNSFFIIKLGIADFIVTLGSLSLVRGIVELMNADTRFSTQSDAFRFLTGGSLLGIPAAVLIALAVAVIGFVVLSRTRMGRTVYAVGLNPAAAFLAGVRVPRVRLGVYMTSGVLAALAGVLLGSRLSSSHPALGTGYELTAIAAAAVGGTSLAGGRGSVFGTVLGALLLCVLQNTLSLLRVNAFWFQIIAGIMIIAAVLLDSVLKRLASSRRPVEA